MTCGSGHAMKVSKVGTVSCRLLVTLSKWKSSFFRIDPHTGRGSVTRTAIVFEYMCEFFFLFGGGEEGVGGEGVGVDGWTGFS